MRSSGRFETSTHHKGNKYCFTVFVIAGQSVNNLLSREVSAALGLVQRIDNVSLPSELVGLLKTTPVKIKLKADVAPYAITTARRVSVPLLSKVKAELDRMVKCGMIEETDDMKSDIFPQLSGATMFSLLDAAIGFWQIPLERVLNSQHL